MRWLKAICFVCAIFAGVFLFGLYVIWAVDTFEFWPSIALTFGPIALASVYGSSLLFKDD